MWDVRTPEGARVDRLVDLADVLGCSEAKAAVDLLDSPFVGLAPERLRAEAEAKAGALVEVPEPDLFALAGVDVKAGLFGGDKGKAKAGDGIATVKRGAYVKWSGSKRGKVDLIVESGAVPGVEGAPVFGSKTSPAARVVVYAKDGDGWKATDDKIAVKASDLTEIDDLPKKGAKKAESKADAALVALLADRVTLVEPTSVKAAFERGLSGWPGPSRTSLTAEQWAVGRATALLDAAEGKVLPGFADGDLL